MKYLKTNLARAVLIGMANAYKTMVSPCFPAACRYYPTCSQYFMDSISERGVWRGLLFAAGRLLRCNPLFPGGFDPIK